MGLGLDPGDLVPATLVLGKRDALRARGLGGLTNANNAPGTRGNPSNLGTMRLLHCLICRKWVIFMSFLSTLLGIFFFGTLFGGS